MILSIPRKHLRALQACVGSEPSRPYLHGIIIDLTDLAHPAMIAADGVVMTISRDIGIVSSAGVPDKVPQLFRPLPFARRPKTDDDIHINVSDGTATDGKTVAKLDWIHSTPPNWRRLEKPLQEGPASPVEEIGMDLGKLGPIAREMARGPGEALTRFTFRGVKSVVQIQWLGHPGLTTWLMPVIC